MNVDRDTRPDPRQSQAIDAAAASVPGAFAAAMSRLGPWEPAPALVAAVSGGADSTALALLADAWARARGGRLLALIVDHRLRPESTDEATLTRDRLAWLGIAARILTIGALPRGPGLAERARAERYRLLTLACNEADSPHLLLGHHALDQAETVMIRALGGSANRGLSGMAALAEPRGPRLLRPLLDQPPGALRAFLRAQGMPWIEDPSNASMLARRSRLRRWLDDPDGAGGGTRAVIAAASAAGRARAQGDRRVARVLAERATIRPEGFALLTPGPIDPDALAALIRTIGGLDYPPPPAAVAMLARDPRPATLSGVRVLRAGRLGPGWLLVREARNLPPPIPAIPGAVWDNRFRLRTAMPPGAVLGAVDADATRLRRLSPWPSAILRTLPALRVGNVLAAVPHLDYRDPACGPAASVIFDPPAPAAGAPFVTACPSISPHWGCATADETLC